MAYLASRLNDAVCVELTNIFDEKIFTDYGTEDDKALGCGLKLHLALCTLKEQWITEQILEKCIEYVDVLINSKSESIKRHVCTTALRIKLEHLGKIKEFLCNLRGQSHVSSFRCSRGTEPGCKLESGKAKVIWSIDWEKAVSVKKIVPLSSKSLEELKRMGFYPEEPGELKAEIDY